jgi:uncharacterized protein (DUF2384 family)
MSAQLTALDLGSLRDHFNLLTKDHRSVRPESLQEFLGGGLPQTELARMLGVPRSTSYQKTVKLSQEFMRNNIVPIAMAADLAVDLLTSKEEARRWMLAPNSYYFGKSPFDVCLLGDGRVVIEFLLRKLGSLSGEKA